ncbi:hypothetical protein K1X84_06660 [bacterium]|nr:hypothetical protein [bacterium]
MNPFIHTSKKFIYSDQRGMTLLESVMTVVFLSITLVGIVRLYGTLAMGTPQASLSIEGTLAAQSQIESVLRDLNNPTRGVQYIKVPQRYPDVTIGEFIVRTQLDTVEHIYNNVPYMLLHVTATHSNLDDISLKMWVTK